MRNPDLQHHLQNLISERTFALAHTTYVEADVLQELADDTKALLDKRDTEENLIAVYEAKVKLYQMQINILQKSILSRYEIQEEHFQK